MEIQTVGSRNGMYVFMGTFVVFVAGLIGGGHQRWTLLAVCRPQIYDVEPPRSER